MAHGSWAAASWNPAGVVCRSLLDSRFSTRGQRPGGPLAREAETVPWSKLRVSPPIGKSCGAKVTAAPMESHSGGVRYKGGELRALQIPEGPLTCLRVP